jgi:septum formation topological specificity factor MinE
MADYKAQDCLTPYGVLHYPYIFTPRREENTGQEPRYAVMLAIPEKFQKSGSDLMKALQEEVIKVAKSYFGDAVNLKKLSLPFRKGEDVEVAGVNESDIILSPRSKYKPGIVDATRQDILDPDDVWPGQIGRLIVRPFGYDVSGKKGVGLALQHVQVLVKDMPRLDGRKSASEAFEKTSGGDVSSDELAKLRADLGLASKNGAGEADANDLLS